jgi:hypothetical protein
MRRIITGLVAAILSLAHSPPSMAVSLNAFQHLIGPNYSEIHVASFATSSGTLVTAASGTITTTGLPVKMIGSADIENSTATTTEGVYLFLNGVQADNSGIVGTKVVSIKIPIFTMDVFTIGAGTYTFELKVNVSAGTGTFNNVYLLAEEMR